MHVVDDPQAVLDRLQDEADRAALTTLPALPLGDGWEVEWPDPDDAIGFLVAARAAGARLLYLEIARASGAWLESAGIVDVATEHRGEVATVAAAWVADGVVHRFEVAARWCEEAVVASRLSQDLDAHDEQAEIERMARILVEDPAFQLHSGPRDDAKYAVIDREFPGLDRPTRRAVWSEANRIDWTERKPAREAEWARQGRAHMAEGLSKVAAAERMGISVNILNRVLQQNPPEPPN